MQRTHVAMLNVRVAKRMQGAPPKTRIAKAVAKAQRPQMEQQHELMATQVFDSVVMYTPRGMSGSAEDPWMPHYPVDKTRYPGLAASAREATELNEAMDVQARKNRSDWLAGKAGAEHVAPP